MKRLILGPGLVLVAAALLAGCGGHNTAPVYNVNLAPTPMPPVPTNPPVPNFNSSSTSALTAGSPAAFPTPQGLSGAFTVPVTGSNVPPGTTLTITLQNTAPAGVTAFTGNAPPLTYVGLETNNTVNVASGSSISVTLPANWLPDATPISLSCYDAQTTAWTLCGGPVAISANTAVLTNSAAYTFTGGVQYWSAIAVGGPVSTTVP